MSAAAGYLAVVLLASAPATAATSCAGNPGSPDQAAVLQYCPKHARGSSHVGAGGVGSTSDAQTPSSSPTTRTNPRTAATARAGSDQTDVPVLGYPSSDGLNLLLLAVLLAAAASAAAYGTRRWRRRRPTGA